MECATEFIARRIMNQPECDMLGHAHQSQPHSSMRDKSMRTLCHPLG